MLVALQAVRHTHRSHQRYISILIVSLISTQRSKLLNSYSFKSYIKCEMLKKIITFANKVVESLKWHNLREI